MGLSGLIGAGASEGLEDLLARQLLEQQQAERERAQQAQEGLQRDRLTQDAAQHEELLGFNKAQAADTAAYRKLTSDREQGRWERDLMAGEDEKFRARDERATQLAALGEAANNPNLPPHLRLFYKTLAESQGALKPAAANPDDFQNPEDKLKADVRRAGAIADAQYGAAARHRAPDDAPGQVVETTDAQGNRVRRWVSNEELRTGVPVPDPPTRPRPVTGAERSALNFYNRATQADEITSRLEQEIAKMTTPGQAWLVNMPNFMQGETGQAYRQAQRAWTEARLRKESGAAVPPSEYENDARTYFAQTGDSEKTIAQKKAARKAVADGIRNEARRAIEEFNTGEPPPDIERPMSESGAGGGTVRMQAPNGQIKDVPADQVEAFKAKGAKVVP